MSCRFQPNYHGDAMYRGNADFRTEPCLDFIVDISTDQFDEFDTTPGRIIPKLPTLPLACGQTITNVEIARSNHSFYRTADRVSNLSYYARRFTVQADDPGKYTITLFNVHGFSPYVTIHRSVTQNWQGTLVDGDFTFTLDSNSIGPLIIEVSSISRYETGAFDIHLACPSHDDFSTMALDCVTTLTDRVIDSGHLSRGFTFSQHFPGVYRIQLSAVAGFSPYIYVDISTNNYPAGGEYLDVPFGGFEHVVSGFIGQVGGVPGTFNISITCPAPPHPVHIKSTSLASLNALFGTSFVSELDYVHDSLYYEQVSGAHNIRLVYDLVSGWYITIDNTLTSFFGGTDPQNPYGVYADNNIGTSVEIIV